MAGTALVSGIVAALLSMLSAFLLWTWAAAAGGRLEAWDGPYYFSVAVPALWFIAAGCGFLAPRMAWRWPALMYATQFAVMLARAENRPGPLLPLGFIMMAVLAAVTAVPAYLGAFARRRVDRSRKRHAISRGPAH
jgi:hypothetical protein